MQQDQSKLIIELIKATNRTTRSVRAFVLFFFIQLIALTIALLVYQIGNAFQDSSDCSYGICQPNPVTSVFAVLIWVTGVLVSSYKGFVELNLSKLRQPIGATVNDPNNTNAAGVYSGDWSELIICDSCGTDLNGDSKSCGVCG